MTVSIDDKFKVQTTVEIPLDDLRSLLVTNLEQGYSWFKATDLIVPEGHTKDEYRMPDELVNGTWAPCYTLPFVEGGGIVIMVDETDDGSYSKKYSLMLHNVNQGLQIMANKYPTHFADLLNDNQDLNTADVWLQCCLFGELIYG